MTEILSWTDFVRDIPDRAVRAVIEARDDIEASASVCERTQSWSPTSTRSSWGPELREVVEAIDALRAAHDAINEVVDDGGDADPIDAAVEARAAAYDALDAAIDAANDRARDLALRVAEEEREEGVERLLLDADQAEDDAEWAAALAKLAGRSSDSDRGWTCEVAEDGVITVTGWAMTRGVTSQDGDRVLGDDWSDLQETVDYGRVTFAIVRRSDREDEPNGGGFATVAEAVAAAESLAEVHSVADWSDDWSIVARWTSAVDPRWIHLEDGSADGLTLAVDTEAEIAEARRVLRDLGLAQAEVWTGEGPDAVKTGASVFV